MEIIVQGKGSKFISPDLVILNINFVEKNNEYDKVLEYGLKNVQLFIEEILIKNNFKIEDLKTRNFTIREEQRFNDSTKTYEKIGFTFNQNAVLRFDYDKVLLARIMEGVSKLNNSPLCIVNFGVKNEKNVRSDVLEIAYKDAENQAYAIATAAGKLLKNCQKVDFKPFASEYASGTRFGSDFMDAEKSFSGSSEMFVNSFTPEDLEIEETLYCSWIAE